MSGKTTCGSITETDLAGITGTLALNRKSISSLRAGDFGGLTNLNELNLAYNSLSSLPAGVFDDLTNLRRLNLYQNNLSNIPAGVFDKLTGLTILNLGYNKMSSLPADVFDKLTSLLTLGLHLNIHLDASGLAGAFDELKSLTSLRLDYSKHSSLPAGIFDQLTALTELRLSGNRLTGLPLGVFDKLTELTFLDLHGNRLRNLRAGVFDKLTKLTQLNLFRNRLTGLSSDVFDKLTKLRALTLNGNQLSTLPEDVFEKQSSLLLLWLHNNNLRTLPSKTFAKLNRLANLNLSGNSDLVCLPVLPRKLSSLSLDKQASAYAACDAGVTVTPTNLTVMPNGTATYTVVLDAAPSRYANGGNVTVKPVSSSTSAATVSDTVIFTAENWSAARTVTVTGAAQGAATISHTASGGGYDGAPASKVGVVVGLAMVVDSITSSTAKLILGGHMGDWYYKHSTPSGGMCSSSPVTGTTTSVTDLSSNTSYTYKAYSDNTCSQELATAGVFVTRPGKPTKPMAASGVNGGEVTVTASVTGSGALTKWQYAKKNGPGSFEPTWTDISATSTTLTHTVTGLTAGTDYQVKVRAVNASGAGAESDASDAAQPPAATLKVGAAKGTTATLTLANWTAAWWHEKTAGPGTATCTSVRSGTNTAILSGLTAGSNYTWTAYSARGCDSLDKIADVDFATARSVSLAVSDVTHNAATLTIRGHTAAWWYKGGQTKARCVPVAPNTSAAGLSGLSAGTSYTYRAYDAADCGSGNVLATATSFTTKAGYLSVAAISAQFWIRDTPIPTLTLPAAAASAGSPTITYALNPALPSGLTFDATSRTISGTPTAIFASTTYTYAAAAANYTAASRTFTIEVLHEPPDFAPSFGGASIADQVHTQNALIEPVTLPEATGGDGELAYELSPELPTGLTFDPATRVLSGTPTEAAETATYTYTATDADAVDPDVATLTFDLTVLPDFAPNFGGASIANRQYQETIPIEPLTLPAATGGDGELTYALSPELPAGLTFDPATRVLGGTPTEAAETATYTYTATDADAVDPDVATLTFEITVLPDLTPDFGGASIADQLHTQNTPSEPVELPAATGGNGALTYALSPALPTGLMFDPATRVLSGTPTEAAETATYTYTATDADAVDPDRATLAFDITVLPDLVPSFGDASIADRYYQETIPIEPVELPAATGGDGGLTYALSPELPAGLTFDPTTRVMDGTPTEAATAASYTYTVTDFDAVDPDTAVLTFTLAVAPDLAPDFGGERIADQVLTRSIAMEPLALPAATGGNGELTYALSPELPAGLTFDPATRVLSGTPTELAGARRYEYTVTDSDPLEPDAAVLKFTIEVTYSAAHKAVLNDALAAQGRALLTGATSVIGERFRAPAAAPMPSGTEIRDRATAALGAVVDWLADRADGSTGLGPPAVTRSVAGRPPRRSARAPPPRIRGPGTAGLSEWSLDQLIRDRSFAVSLRGGSAASEGDPPRSRWTLWGAVDAQRFDGASQAGRLDGGVASLYLGADVRLGGGLVVGAAVSRSAGEADYDVDDGAGRLETNLTGVHPYIRGETGWGLELWAIGGTGAGRAEDLSDHAGATPETADLAMRMTAAGLRQPLSRLGAVRFSVVGAVGTVWLTTGEGEGPQRAVGGLDAAVTQGRLALEIAHAFGALSSYIRLGARSDGGDGLSGRGAEVVGGLRYSGGRVDFEATARWLAAHSEEAYREYGGMARLVFKSRADGSGVRMSLSPRAGDTGGTLPGVGEGLLGGSNVGALFPTNGAGLREFAPVSLAGELGYGLLLGRSLLTLGATHDRDGRGARETFGLTWEPRESRVGGGLSFRFGYERSTVAEHGGPRLDLTYSARF